MILVGIFAEVGLLANSTSLLERSFIRSSIRTGLCRKDFLVEDFRRDWWKGSNAAF
jgi:hypothetical protein